MRSVLTLEVPVIVRLGERTMTVSEAMLLAPGSLIELPKAATEELDVLINNRPIGVGVAVKIGENFGVRVTYVGDLALRVAAVKSGQGADIDENDEAAMLAAQLLDGQF